MSDGTMICNSLKGDERDYCVELVQFCDEQHKAGKTQITLNLPDGRTESFDDLYDCQSFAKFQASLGAPKGFTSEGKKLESKGAPTNFERGMLIFERLHSCYLVDIIRAATNSEIAHVGIVDRDGDKLVVIEAFGSAVRVTPLDEFLGRSDGYYSVKKIDGIHGNPEKVKRFIDSARKFLGKPYDDEFRYDNGKIYCSELVGLAAQAAGINLFSVEVPVDWLDLSSKKVGEYILRLQSVGAWGGYDSPLLPPNTLYFSDALQDVPSSGHSVEKSDIPAYELYDTLPGKTVDEKYQYVKKKYESVKDDVDVKTRKTSQGAINYHFRVERGGRRFGLTLFGKFSEERQLAEKICRIVDCP